MLFEPFSCRISESLTKLSLPASQNLIQFYNFEQIISALHAE